MDLTQEKKCSSCREVKPHAEFPARSDRPDGRDYTCRSCKRAKQRQRYVEQNKDKVRAQRPRRPLPDAAKAAGWELRKDVERIERIFADDRFGTYSQQVAMQVHGHLEYAARVCQDLMGRLAQIGD